MKNTEELAKETRDKVGKRNKGTTDTTPGTSYFTSVFHVCQKQGSFRNTGHNKEGICS